MKKTITYLDLLMQIKWGRQPKRITYDKYDKGVVFTYDGKKYFNEKQVTTLSEAILETNVTESELPYLELTVVTE